MSIREAIFTTLKQSGVDVYLPGQHEGECKKPYVEISDGGTYALGKTTGRKSFLVTGYVPMDRPLDLRSLLAQVATVLTRIKNIRSSGEVSPEDFDDERKAVFATIEYTALCAI